MLNERTPLTASGRRNKGKKSTACSTVTGVLLICVSIALVVVCGWWIPGKIDKKVAKSIANKYVPDVGTEDWQEFLDNSAGSEPREFLIFTMYDIVNAESLLRGNTTLEVREVGPFVYQILRQRIDWNRTDDTVEFLKFENYKLYTDEVVFTNAEYGTTTTYKSLDPDTVKVTQINPISLAIAHQLRYNPYHDPALVGVSEALCAHAIDTLDCLAIVSEFGFGRTVASIFQDDPIFSERTVSQWLGIERAKALNSTFLELVHGFQKIPSADNRFGFFYNVSVVSPEETREYTRPLAFHFNRNDLDTAMSYVEWEGNKVLPGVNTTAHNPSLISTLNFQSRFAGWLEDFSLNGQLSETHTHPSLDPDEPLHFWLGAGARSVEFSYKTAVQNRGIDSWRFTPSPDNFNPNETGAFYFSTVPGFANESSTRSYAPVHASNVHFLGFEKEVAEMFSVTGVPAASVASDGTFVDVEPETGLIVAAAERLQINVLLPSLNWTHAQAGFNLAANLYPTFYFKKQSELTERNAVDLRQIGSARVLQTGFYLIAGVVGAASLALGVFIIFRSRNQGARVSSLQATGYDQAMYNPIQSPKTR